MDRKAIICMPVNLNSRIFGIIYNECTYLISKHLIINTLDPNLFASVARRLEQISFSPMWTQNPTCQNGCAFQTVVEY
jgi:hypothetical protein